MTHNFLSFLKKHSGLVALFSLLLTLTTIFSYKHIKPLIVQRALDSITRDFHAKHHAVTEYLEKKVSTITQISQHQETISFASSHKNGKSFAHFLQSRLSSKNFRDAFLVEANGEILFSLKKQSLIGHNITKKPYKQVAFGKAFKRAFMTMRADTSPITRTIGKGQQTILISVPIEHNRKLIGVFIAELMPQELFSIITNKSYSYNASEAYLARSRSKRVHIIPLNKQQELLVKKTTPYFKQLLDACHGTFSQGQSINHRQQKMLTVSGYLPEIHSGLVVALPYFYATALLTFLFWFIFILGLCTLCIGIMWHHGKGVSIRQRMTQLSSPRPYLTHVYHNLLPHIPYTILGMALCGALITFGRYNKIKQHEETKAHAQTNSTMRYIAQQLNSALFSAQSTGKTIGEIVNSKNFSNQDIAEKAINLIQQHHTIWSISVAFQPHQFKAEKRLHAPLWVRTKKGTVAHYSIDETYDYTVPEGSSHVNTNWYKQTIKSGAQWNVPYFDPTTHKKVLSYSLPFYYPDDIQQTTPRGVINITYRLKTLRMLIETLGHNIAAHSIIMNKQGHLIYHPNMNLVLEHKTVFDITKGNFKNPILAMHHYLSRTTKNFSWVHDEHVPLTDWVFASAFTKDSIAVPAQLILNVMMLLIIFLSLVLFFLLYFLAKHYTPNRKRYVMIAYTFALACGKRPDAKMQ